MPRTQNCLCKDIKFEPNVVYFKPQGVPMRDLEIVEVSMEEVEAYRLRHVEKLGDALINGKAIKIIKHE